MLRTRTVNTSKIIDVFCGVRAEGLNGTVKIVCSQYHITLTFNNNMSTAAVFLDNEKAFDKTWHLYLLYKLSELKFSTSLIKLINSFLSQRKFRPSVEGELSTPRDIKGGVPQGSVLSHIVQSIYK
jgi:hypothetical protein